MSSAFVEFRHVYATYGSTMALQDVSFSLRAHDHVVVFGPPASGKTTLLRLLSGIHIPHAGQVMVNGKKPSANPHAKEGYVSVEHNGKSSLSTSERVHHALTYLASSHAPILLLDDVADVLGAQEMKKVLSDTFAGRCVCVATRNPVIAEALELPILLLHDSSLAHTGSRESIAHEAGVTRVVDAWIEGMRYDLLRKLRAHPGVLEVRLLSCDQFDGNRIRITLRNSRYLPSLYDVVSQASLVRIEELPPSLTDILSTLTS